LNDAIGDVRIEAWDQPGVEMHTNFSSEDQVRIAAETHSSELTLNTIYPRRKRLGIVPRPPSGYFETHIYVPRDARLKIHGSANVYIDTIAGAIDADIAQGTVLLRIPEQGRYDIDARTKLGSITSDFPGVKRRTHSLMGHTYEDQSSADAQTLHLRVGYGDITILKSRQPRVPAALRPAS
jgi:hypothetical protein